MKRILLCAGIAFLFLSSCQTFSTREKELESKQKQLELKEKELAQKDADFNRATAETPTTNKISANKTQASPKPGGENSNSSANTKKQEKRLRYLFAANGGLVGYFSDGSVVGCPRCDLSKENVDSLSKTKPHATYTAKKDYLLVGGKEKIEIYADGEVSPDWAILDYKKLIKF